MNKQKELDSLIPDDFRFKLSQTEFEHWKSQIVTSNPAARMSLRKRPNAFTEQGVAMLSSVLKSDRAVQINIQIIRTFTRLRQILASNVELRAKIEEMDGHIQSIYKILGQQNSAPLTLAEMIPDSRAATQDDCQSQNLRFH